MDWAKKTARRDEKHLCLGIGCTYIRDLTVCDNASCKPSTGSVWSYGKHKQAIHYDQPSVHWVFSTRVHPWLAQAKYQVTKALYNKNKCSWYIWKIHYSQVQTNKRGGICHASLGPWQSTWSQTSFAHCFASPSVASVLSHSLSRLGQHFLPIHLLGFTIIQWPCMY